MAESPTLTYQVKNGRILNHVDGHEAMIQGVDKILKTDRFVYPIYDQQYGNDFSELFGKSFSYAVVEVKRMLTEALLADSRINSVDIESVTKTDLNTLIVIGSCQTIYGNIPIKSEVSVNES